MGARVGLVGMGTVGRLLVPQLLRQGHTLVMATGRGQVVGADAGELAGIDALDVPVRDDVAGALAETRPEVVLMSTASTLAATADDMEACIAAGCAVITAAEEAVAPWATAPELADRLHAQAQSAGVAIIGSGHLDALWVHMPLVLSGIAAELTALEGETFRPFATSRSSNAAIAALLGRPVEQFPVEVDEDPGPGAALQALQAIAAGLGASVTTARSRLDAATSTEPLLVSVGGEEREVAPGTIAGSRRTITLTTAEGITLTLHDTALVGAHSVEHWTLNGTPPVELTTTASQGLTSTATQMVNRIPYVLAARPGLRTLSELPPLVAVAEPSRR